jgi:transposase-like protein
VLNGATVTDVGRRYEVARQTLHDWLRGYATGGMAALSGPQLHAGHLSSASGLARPARNVGRRLDDAPRNGGRRRTVVVEALIGLAALNRRSRGPVVAGFVLALAIWMVGRDLGQLYIGAAGSEATCRDQSRMGTARCSLHGGQVRTLGWWAAVPMPPR